MKMTHLTCVEDVFNDFKGRWSGLIKALTEEKEKLFELCDPGKGSLCLHGNPHGSWEVRMPFEKLPSELPEPFVGINHARDKYADMEWPSFVAAHSDAWLLSVALFSAACIGFGKSERERLFDMINELPTVSEVVKKEKPNGQSGILKGERSGKKKKMPPHTEELKPENMNSEPKEDKKNKEKEEDEEDNIVCSYCCEHDVADGLWIQCDFCSTWFHCKCVKVSAAEAERMEQYKCPYCRNKTKGQL